MKHSASYQRRGGPHTAHQTSLTRTGKADLTNGKPFRTAHQKAIAKATARKCDDGTYRSSAPVTLHPKKRAA